MHRSTSVHTCTSEHVQVHVCVGGVYVCVRVCLCGCVYLCGMAFHNSQLLSCHLKHHSIIVYNFNKFFLIKDNYQVFCCSSKTTVVNKTSHPESVFSRLVDCLEQNIFLESPGMHVTSSF